MQITSQAARGVRKILVRAVSSFYVRNARKRRFEKAKAAVVAFEQRFDQSPRLNLHYHCLWVDGSFTCSLRLASSCLGSAKVRKSRVSSGVGRFGPERDASLHGSSTESLVQRGVERVLVDAVLVGQLAVGEALPARHVDAETLTLSFA